MAVIDLQPGCSKQPGCFFSANDTYPFFSVLRNPFSPKPIDTGLMLFNFLGAQEQFAKPAMFKLLESGPGFSPGLSILSTLLITAALLSLSVCELRAKGY